MRTTQRIATMMSALVLIGLSSAPLGAQTTEQKGGPQEGIKVHGHWTITVRNPDGTIASTREFENALLQGTAGGAELLTALLTGSHTPGGWQVEVGNSHAGVAFAVCDTSAALNSGFCLASQSAGSVSVQRPALGTVRLTGSVRADLVGGALTFDTVRTWLFVCPPTTTPQSCLQAGSGAFRFSGTTVTSPIPVRFDQVIQFTVDFSFS